MKASTRRRPRLKGPQNGRSRSTRAGREIIGALKEAVEAVERGEPMARRFTVRTVNWPDNPLPYDGPAVRATRNMLAASQPVFARLMGVSTVLVQSWENGKRKPAAWACRLLDEVNRDPQHWRQMLLSAAGESAQSG